MFGLGTDEECEEADNQFEQARKAYFEYVEAIRPRCSEGVRQLLVSYLHDARFNFCSFDRRTKRVRCEIDATHAPYSPYYSSSHKLVMLTFLGVSAWTGPLPRFRDWWLYEELEMRAPEDYSLSLIFSRHRGPRVSRDKLLEFRFSQLELDVH